MLLLNIKDTHVLSQLSSVNYRKGNRGVDITSEGTPFIYVKVSSKFIKELGVEAEEVKTFVAVECSKETENALPYTFGEKGNTITRYYIEGLPLENGLEKSILHKTLGVLR